MVGSPKLPSRYLKLSKVAKDVKVGTMGSFALDALRIDLDHRGWINPYAEVVRPASPMEAYLNFKRVEGGFQIGLQDAPFEHWETGAKPDPEETRGLEWFPVVEFVGGGD